MNKKYDKFLFTYAVAKRAKEIMEEGNCLIEDPKEQDKRPIMEAIKEFNKNLITIDVTQNKKIDLKEEEDTLDTLYDSVKYPELAEVSSHRPKMTFNMVEEEKLEEDEEEVIDADAVLEEEIIDDTEKDEVVDPEVEIEAFPEAVADIAEDKD
ncbi:MAG: DNA-directed RNA polymerase subunit omega [Candidatus Margulisbacteria bacterium]|nr:DNA-directed RNA polymerase subunit omega [Candidatus Margulisiibacteriota bacterium]